MTFWKQRGVIGHLSDRMLSLNERPLWSEFTGASHWTPLNYTQRDIKRLSLGCCEGLVHLIVLDLGCPPKCLTHSLKVSFVYKEPFSLIKNLLWNGMVPWMLKVFHGTIDANKEPLCYRCIQDVYGNGTHDLDVACYALFLEIQKHIAHLHGFLARCYFQNHCTSTHLTNLYIHSV